MHRTRNAKFANSNSKQYSLRISLETNPTTVKKNKTGILKADREKTVPRHNGAYQRGARLRRGYLFESAPSLGVTRSR